MFTIQDYKKIIEQHWSKNLSGDNLFRPFQDLFSIDVGLGRFNSLLCEIYAVTLNATCPVSPRCSSFSI
jgi:hypothetical protein